MHALQALVANFEPLDDLHLNLHELNILNLYTKTAGQCQEKKYMLANIFRRQSKQWIVE